MMYVPSFFGLKIMMRFLPVIAIFFCPSVSKKSPGRAGPKVDGVKHLKSPVSPSTPNPQRRIRFRQTAYHSPKRDPHPSAEEKPRRGDGAKYRDRIHNGGWVHIRRAVIDQIPQAASS